MGTRLDQMVRIYGVGTLLAAATLDGYSRQVLNDGVQETLRTKTREINALSKEEQKIYSGKIDAEALNNKTQGILSRYKKAADEHQRRADLYAKI